MINFCTMYDHKYLLRGIALYNSIKTNCKCDYKIWVLALDDDTFKILSKLSLSNLIPIRLSDFEDEELLKVKPIRSTVEYYWTMTPSLPLYVLKNDLNADNIIYVDADCCFFADPEGMFCEMDNSSILIHEHRYSMEYKSHEESSGRFNVGLMIFRRDSNGLAALEWWRERCLEWCYFRHDNGKLGDQMYLNSFPDLFKGVKISQNIGLGAAPWNIKNYRVWNQNGMIMLDNSQLLLFHFHSFKYYGINFFDPAPAYFPSNDEMSFIYGNYSKQLNDAYSIVSNESMPIIKLTDSRPNIGQLFKRKISIWRHRQMV